MENKAREDAGLEGIVNEEENCPDFNVGSIAGAAKTNVYALSKQDNTTNTDRQESCTDLPKGCLPEDRELMLQVKNFKDGKMIQDLYFAKGKYSKGNHIAHCQTLCKKLAFYTGNNAAQMERIFRSSKLHWSGWDESKGNLTYGQTIIKKAIADTPDTYKPKKQPTGGGNKSDATLDGLKDAYGVKDEYVSTLGNEKFLFPNLIIENHILVIIALSGGGKTTFLYNHVAPELAKAGYKVWYVDADSPPSDHKKMKAIADKYGFNFLIPDVNQGTSVESLIKYIKKLADSGTSLDKQVFFFDTLKKFIDLMSKKSTKEFFVLMRKLTKLGATVVLPGHANKHRDPDGSLLFEGVGDVKSDADDLIYFEKETSPGGSIVVTTVVDSDKGAKVRAVFEPFSFTISKDRKIAVLDKPIDTIDRSISGTAKASEEEIIQTAVDYLKKAPEPVKQSQLVDHTMDMLSGQAGKNKVRKVIVQSAVFKGEPLKLGTRLICTVGKKNSHFYELPESEPAQNDEE